MIVGYMSLYGGFGGSSCFVFQVTGCLLLLLLSFTSAAEHRIGDKSFGGKHLANECNLLIISSPVARQIQHLPQVCQQDSPQDSPQPSFFTSSQPRMDHLFHGQCQRTNSPGSRTGSVILLFILFPPSVFAGDIIYNQWDLGLYFASH